MSLTRAQYYSEFFSVTGCIAGVISGLPFLSQLFSDSLGPYLFPPLGNIEVIGRVGTAILSVATTFVIYLTFKESPRSVFVKAVRLSLIAVSLFIFSYIGCYLRFVRPVAIQTLNEDIFVSVGYERTEFAMRNFPGATDFEMLKQRGPFEEEVQRLWTFKSIFIARAGLWVCYTCFVVSLISILSFGTLEDSLSKAGSNP